MIATAMGNVVKLSIEKGLFISILYAIGRYMTHGVFEIAAYFVAGLAGGIISIAIIKHDFGSDKFIHVLTDSIDLIVLSLVMLVVGAIIEVYVTPVLF